MSDQLNELDIAELADRLAEQSRENIRFGQGWDDSGWGMQEGVLITNREAAVIAEMLPRFLPEDDEAKP